MRKIILEEQDIKEFEQRVNNLPCFAKNVAENMVVAQAIQELMKFMGEKFVETPEATVLEEPTKPIGGGGGSPIKPNNAV